MTTQTPKLRFPEFSDEWEMKKLGEILKIGSGKDYKHLGEGDIPVFGTGGLMTKVDKYLYDGETVCIGRKGTIDKPMYFNGKIWTVDTLFYTHSFKNATPKFVYNLFLRVNWKLFNEAGGVPSLSKSTIEQIDLSLPQLPEQTKIANFLTAIDEKIQALKQKKTLLEQYKKGIMQQIFSQELRFKNDDGSDFDDWEEKSLGEITFKTDKKNKDKEVLPIYSISNKNGFVHQSEQFDGVDSVERGYDTSLYKIVESGTFAYNPARINVGSIGYSGNLERVLVSSLYVCFKTISTVNNQFFSQFLATKHFNDSVNRSSEGGIRVYLFYENFSQIKINLPTLPEQTKIVNFLTAIDEKIEKVSQQITATETYKKGLLQQMFI